jgi:hypothetical protein
MLIKSNYNFSLKSFQGSLFVITLVSLFFIPVGCVKGLFISGYVYNNTDEILEIIYQNESGDTTFTISPHSITSAPPSHTFTLKGKVYNLGNIDSNIFSTYIKNNIKMVVFYMQYEKDGIFYLVDIVESKKVPPIGSKIIFPVNNIPPQPEGFPLKPYSDAPSQ